MARTSVSEVSPPGGLCLVSRRRKGAWVSPHSHARRGSRDVLCFPTTEAGGTVGTSCPGHATGLVHVHRNASEEGAGGSALRSLLKTRSHRPAREEEPVAVPVAQPSLKLPAAGEPSPGRPRFRRSSFQGLPGPVLICRPKKASSCLASRGGRSGPPR